MAENIFRFEFFFFHLFIKAWTTKKDPSPITCPSNRELVTSDVIPGTCQTKEENLQ